jgi:Holliday junction resolvase
MTSAYRSQQGRNAELELMAFLAERNFLVASRRHIAGAGDVLAVRALAMARLPSGAHKPMHEVWLLEVKTTAGGPYERFGPKDRAAMLETAQKAGAAPLLAWRPPKKEWKFIGPDEWP